MRLIFWAKENKCYFSMCLFIFFLVFLFCWIFLFVCLLVGFILCLLVLCFVLWRWIIGFCNFRSTWIFVRWRWRQWRIYVFNWVLMAPSNINVFKFSTRVEISSDKVTLCLFFKIWLENVSRQKSKKPTFRVRMHMSLATSSISQRILRIAILN